MDVPKHSRLQVRSMCGWRTSSFSFAASCSLVPHDAKILSGHGSGAQAPAAARWMWLNQGRRLYQFLRGPARAFGGSGSDADRHPRSYAADQPITPVRGTDQVLRFSL
jgi:hypothetical protein